MLGTWQVFRREEKRKLKEERQRRISFAPEPLPLIDNEKQRSSLELRTFYLEGEFLKTNEFLIGPRPCDGETGFLQVLPFRLTDDRIVFINRGWIPRTFQFFSKRHKDHFIEAPEGHTKLRAVLRGDSPRNAFTPDNDLVSGQWFSLTASDFATQVSGSLPILLDDHSVPYVRQKFPYPAETLAPLPDNHLHYVFTWYTLGICLSAMSYKLNRGGW